MKNYISWRYVLQQMFKLFPSQSNHFSQSWSKHVYSSIYFHLWKVFPTCFETLMQMIEIADFHTKHPLVQTTPYIVVARVAIWTVWRPHIWRQVLWHIIIQVRKCSSLCMCTSAIVLEYVMVSPPRGCFVEKSAISIICMRAWDMLGRVSTGGNRCCHRHVSTTAEKNDWIGMEKVCTLVIKRISKRYNSSSDNIFKILCISSLYNSSFTQNFRFFWKSAIVFWILLWLVWFFQKLPRLMC